MKEEVLFKALAMCTALGQGGGPAKPLQWSFRIVGLAATITVTEWVTRMARKALAGREVP